MSYVLNSYLLTYVQWNFEIVGHIQQKREFDRAHHVMNVDQYQATANPQTKRIDLWCEVDDCMLLSSNEMKVQWFKVRSKTD